MSRRISSAAWAVVIVTVSMGAAYGFDALGLQSLAGIALAPVYPVLLAIVALAGGFHTASGESRWMLVTAVVSIVIWWLIITGWRTLRAARH